MGLIAWLRKFMFSSVFFAVSPWLGTGFSIFLTIADDSMFSLVFLVVFLVRFLGLTCYAAWDTRQQKLKVQQHETPFVSESETVASVMV